MHKAGAEFTAFSPVFWTGILFDSEFLSVFMMMLDYRGVNKCSELSQLDSGFAIGHVIADVPF